MQRHSSTGTEDARSRLGRLLCLSVGLLVALGALPAFGQEADPGAGEAVPPAAEESVGGDEGEAESEVDAKKEEARRKREEAAEAKRRAAEARKAGKADKAKKPKKAKEPRKRPVREKPDAAEDRKPGKKAGEKKADEGRKRDGKRAGKEEAARKKQPRAKTTPKARTTSRKRAGAGEAEAARREKQAARLGLSEEQIRREAVIRKAQVTLPPDLRDRLVYVWSLPFKTPVSRDSVWVRGDIVLLLTDGTVLYCIRKRDGVPLWAIDLGHEPQYPPAVSSRMVYVFVQNRLVGIDRMAGQIIWRLNPTFAPAAAPCVSEPHLYCPGWDKRLHAIEIVSKERVYYTSGASEETFKATEYDIRYVWHKTTGGHIRATPALVEGFLYFGSEDGYLYAVSVDGEDRYQSQTQGPIRAPVTARGTNVYVGSGDYSAYAFDRLTGRERWSLPSGATIVQAICPDVPTGVAIVPALKNGIYGIFDRQTPEQGKELWHLVDAEYIAGVSRELVYLVLTDNRLTAVEKKTGTVRWISLLEGVSEVVANVNDWTRSDDRMRLFCLTKSGHLACLREEEEVLKRALERR